MSAKFLGSTGLTQLVTLIKNILTLKADSANGSGGVAKRAAAIPFGQVDSTSTSTAFTATIPGITELHSGVCVFLMNGVVTSESGFTVNINNLGAKPVYSTLSAASRSTTLFNVAYTLLLVYNEERVSGGCWDAYYGYDSNTNTIGYQLRTNSTTMPTLDKFYRYRLLFTAADRKHLVPANTSSSTSADTAKTTTQRPIDPFGAIYYYGHTTAISANANPTASYFWTQYSFALGYSFNRTGAALTLTNHAPVYIKCAPQADGSTIIDADNPFVQTLPSTADGKIYIFLGVASSATTVELVPEHPVYYYDSGIKLWLGRQVYTKPSTGIPASDLASDVQTSLGKADTALQTAPVASVNGKTGAVVLKTSDLTNDSGFITASQVPTVTVDSALSSTSENPVQNKVINTALQSKGTYSKPSGGIPASDLAQAVQTSLGKADTALQEHQSLSAYRTASEQDAIDSEQNTAIAAKYTRPSDGIPTSDFNLADLGTWLDNAGATIYMLSLSGTTVTLNKSFLVVYYSLADSARHTLFVLPIGGTEQQPIALEMYLVHADAQNYTITLACVYNGNRYSVTLSAASAITSPMTGTLVTESIVTQSDVPTTISELTNDSNYQTATQVQTAISGKANTADLATVATSGSYNDLSDKPSIPDEPFVIPLNYSASQDTWTTTATATEIRANADNCVVVVPEGGYRIPLKLKIYYGGENQLLYLVFNAMTVAEGVSAAEFLVMLSGDNVSVTYSQASLYSKPRSGIPASDLASDVQTSLGKADTALQQHQSLSAYRTASAQDAIDGAQDTAIAAKYTKPSGGIPASDIADGVIPTVPTTEINANTAARHTHSNKALLDSYSQTEANLADAVSKRHSHTNKTVLDGITSSKVSEWDNKQDAISDLAAIRSGASAGATAVQPNAISDMATQTWVGQQGYQTAAQVENAIPIKSVQVNGTALTPDANKAVNIQLAQIAYTLEDSGETLFISNIIELPSSEETSF